MCVCVCVCVCDSGGRLVEVGTKPEDSTVWMLMGSHFSAATYANAAKTEEEAHAILTPPPEDPNLWGQCSVLFSG